MEFMFTDLKLRESIVGIEYYASYSKKRITIDNTVISLREEGRIHVEGLDESTFLICYREGRLVFPNSIEDHHLLPDWNIYEGDELIWLKYDGIPLKFLEAIQHRVTSDQFEQVIGSGFTFRVVKNGNLNLQDHLIPWIPSCMLTMIPIMIILTTLLVVLTPQISDQRHEDAQIMLMHLKDL